MDVKLDFADDPRLVSRHLRRIVPSMAV